MATERTQSVSITKVALTPRTKDVCSALQIKYRNSLTNHLLTNQQALYSLRQDLIEMLPEYKLREQSPHSYPDFFTLVLLVIADIESVNELDDLLRPLYRFNLFAFDLTSEIPNHEFKCSCSHSCFPENLYSVQNKNTGLEIIIGCDCAEKKKLITKEEQKELKQRAKTNPVYKKFKAERIKINEEKKLSRLNKEMAEKKIGEMFCSYIEARKTKKNCRNCKELKIELKSPHWVCYSCYSASRRIFGIGRCLL